MLFNCLHFFGIDFGHFLHLFVSISVFGYESLCFSLRTYRLSIVPSLQSINLIHFAFLIKNIFENDENKWGIEASLELVDTCALVLDIHHHWVREAEYILPSDDRYLRLMDSWRGVRPVIHYSVSREDILIDHNPFTLPNMENLIEQGYKKQKLRAHSDFMWNWAVNDWALSFGDTADIMVESKAKNLASINLYKYYKGEHNVEKVA